MARLAVLPVPSGIPSPVLWGDEAVVRERFGALASKICDAHGNPGGGGQQRRHV